jgi:hypothetical protein
VKPTAADHDPVFDRLVAHGLEKEADASGQACPDADLLAAWFDRSLSPVEASRIEAHAASCSVCQQVLADLARSEPEVIRAATEPRPARPLFWHWRWVVPAATAIVVAIVGARTLIAPSGVPTEVAQFAQKQAPPPPPPSAGPDRPAGIGEATPAPSTVVPEAARSASPAVAPAGAMATPVGTKLEGRLADRRAEQPAPAANAPAPVGAAPSANDARPPVQKTAADARPAQIVAEAPARPQAPPPAVSAVESMAVAQPAKTTERADAGVARPAAARAAVAPQSAFLVGGPPAQQITASAEPSGSPVLWRYGDRGAIERSEDRGQTWERQQSGVDTRLVDASSPTSRICWVVGAGGTILRTTDGRTWERVKSPTAADLVSIHAWSENSATLTAADRTVYTTADGGRSWQRR